MSGVIGFNYVEENILSEGTSLNKGIERNGKQGLNGSESTCLMVVEMLCWGGVLKVLVVGHLSNALNSYLSLWEVGWQQYCETEPFPCGILTTFPGR